MKCLAGMMTVFMRRMIKSDDEIQKMLKATDIAHKSLIELDVRSKQENGAEEWECAYELGYLMRMFISTL